MISRICEKCGSKAVSLHPVLHHFICAYIGPDYDFIDIKSGKSCPKCNRPIKPDGRDWEIVGDTQFCHQCGDEKML